MIPLNGSSFGRTAGRLRRYRKRQHLRNRPRVDPKTPRRFPPAQTLNLNRITNLSIELHALHPPAPAASDKGHLLPDFYSGATGLPGRFTEGFLLRRLQLRAPFRCSTEPGRLKWPIDSTHRWMRRGAQVNLTTVRASDAAELGDTH